MVDTRESVDGCPQRKCTVKRDRIEPPRDRPRRPAAAARFFAVIGAAAVAFTTNGLGARAADPTWLVNTVAGNGIAGFSGDGGQAVNAELNNPNGIAVDAVGDIYFADTNNNRVREIGPTGSITTVAGSTSLGFSGDGGPATSAELNTPIGIALDSSGNLYIADSNNARIREVDRTGTITTVAGNGQVGFGGDGGPATSAKLFEPNGVAVDALGNIYIADGGNSRVRKVNAVGTITTVAGNGTASFAGDGGPATTASLWDPVKVAVDSTGNLYIADFQNYRIRKVDSSGIITTIAGDGSVGCTGDGGLATNAAIGNAKMALDPQGNVYLTGCSTVREVNTAGTITTVAGNGTSGYAGDGGQAGSAEFSYVGDLAVATNGTVYLSDANNSRIRELHAPLIGDDVLIPVPGASVTVPGLPVPVLGNVYATPDGAGGYKVVLTVDGTTLPAVDVFDDNLITPGLNQSIGGPTSPFTVTVNGFVLSVPISVDAIVVGPQICLLSVGGTCLAPAPLSQNNLTSGEELTIQVCAQGTPVGCVTREIPF
jgi:sugar lactone lactonase YvrE